MAATYLAVVKVSGIEAGLDWIGDGHARDAAAIHMIG